MDTKDHYQIIIVGGGIAGASLAYFLGRSGISDVLILEKEEQPAYHSTGRSAAVLVRIDPIPSVLELKLLGADFLYSPPEGFSDHPLLVPSGILALFDQDWWSLVEGFFPFLDSAGVAYAVLSPDEVLSQVPVLTSGHFHRGLLLSEDGHIDVHGLLWGYLGHAKKHGAELRCGTEVLDVIVDRGRCRGVRTPDGEIRADRVVNAAGAWAGRVGNMAGAAPIELTPKRRTVISFLPPGEVKTDGWPFLAHYSTPLYFGRESAGLIASPMDEDPMEPCDARPDERVVAQTIHRMESLAPRLVPRALQRTWAGLRTFAPDQGFVVGDDPLVKGFFWLAGQGGAGIETSPAVGRIAADLILEGKTDRIDEKVLSPQRFR